MNVYYRPVVLRSRWIFQFTSPLYDFSRFVFVKFQTEENFEAQLHNSEEKINVLEREETSYKTCFIIVKIISVQILFLNGFNYSEWLSNFCSVIGF